MSTKKLFIRIKKLKKFLSLTSLFFLTSFAFADNNPPPIKGINYDPIHSFEFAKGVGMDDANQMEKAILLDFDRLKKLHHDHPEVKPLDHIKTYVPFYSSSGLHHTPVIANIADIADKWNKKNPDDPITLALGVYECEKKDAPCDNHEQVDAVIAAANQYPNLIDRIMVGNEDLEDEITEQTVENGQSITTMPQKIAYDIKQIKEKLKNKNIKVGTPQKPGPIYNLQQDLEGGRDSSYKIVLDQADFIGINPYPFYSEHTFYNTASSFMATELNNYAHFNALFKKEIVITEEGWPSQGKAGWLDKTHGSSPWMEKDYFYYWVARKTDFTSYYFLLFDKLPGQGEQEYWGILSADRNSSILDDLNKPYNKEAGHIRINFQNLLDDAVFKENSNKKIAVYACITDDLFVGEQNENIFHKNCYPIYGTRQVLDANYDLWQWQDREFMIDTSVDAIDSTYKSLVLYSDDSGVLCKVDSATLKSFVNKTWVGFNGIDKQGNCNFASNPNDIAEPEKEDSKSSNQ